MMHRFKSFRGSASPITLFIVICLIAILPSTSWGRENTDKSKDLLVLSVLPLMDKAGSVGYRYLSEAISFTIDERLKKKIKYRPYKSSKAEAYLKNILKKEKKKCLRPAACAGRWVDLSKSHLLKLTRDKNIDVVVYGEYKGSEFDQKGDISKMLIRVGVFLNFQNKTYWIEDEVSLDTSLFTVVEEIADDLVVEIYNILSGNDEKSFAERGSQGAKDHSIRKALIRFKEYKNDNINDRLKAEIEEFTDHMSDQYNLRFLNMEDFRDDHIEEDSKSEGADISNKKTLLKWMRYFNIPNLVEFKLKKQDFLVTLIPIGQNRRKKKYKSDALEEKKKKIWSRLARGFRKNIPTKGSPGELTTPSLQRKLLRVLKKPKPSFEAGLRVGYFYPMLLGETPAGSSKLQPFMGYSIEAYSTQSLSLFTSLSNSPYLPDSHAFLSLEGYESEESISMRVGLSLGFLYSLDYSQDDSIKVGAAWGLNYESITLIEEEELESDIFSSVYILLGYGRQFDTFSLSAFLRIFYSPDKSHSLLGLGFSVAAGYPIHFK